MILCAAPGCGKAAKTSATRPSDYCSRACQQKAYRFRKDLQGLAELQAAFVILNTLMQNRGTHLAALWTEFISLAREHTNLAEQLTRGRKYYTTAVPLAGSQAHEPVSSLQPQGGTRIGDDPAALGEGE
jgi:hypothetical protein